MAKDWDYAKLAKDASKHGGPKNYVKDIKADGKIEGAIAGAVGGAIIGSVLWPKIKKKAKDIISFFKDKKEIKNKDLEENNECQNSINKDINIERY